MLSASSGPGAADPPEPFTGAAAGAACGARTSGSPAGAGGTAGTGGRSRAAGGPGRDGGRRGRYRRDRRRRELPGRPGRELRQNGSRLAGGHPQQSRKRRLGHPQVGEMAVRHGPLERRVGLGALSLGRLDDLQPTVVGAGRGRRSGDCGGGLQGLKRQFPRQRPRGVAYRDCPGQRCAVRRGSVRGRCLLRRPARRGPVRGGSGCGNSLLRGVIRRESVQRGLPRCDFLLRRLLLLRGSVWQSSLLRGLLRDGDVGRRSVQWRVGAPVVAAVDLDRHSRPVRLCCPVSPRCPGAGGAERGGVHRDAAHGQSTEPVQQDGQTGPATAIEADGRVLAIAQDLAGQPGEDRAGTDLHEGAHAVGVHGVDDIHEPHRRGELVSEAHGAAHPGRPDRRWRRLRHRP